MTSLIAALNFGGNWKFTIKSYQNFFSLFLKIIEDKKMKIKKNILKIFKLFHRIWCGAGKFLKLLSNHYNLLFRYWKNI